MSTKTGIEWTDATWNPIRGCSRVSEGCRHCYAEKDANRFSGPGKPYEGLIQLDPATGKGNGKWSGQIKFVEKHLLDPLRWKAGRRIFVNSMSDLFHEGVTDEMLDRIFAVMALCPQHTFQVLTKRPARMLAYLSTENPRYTCRKVFDLHDEIGHRDTFDCDLYWPLMNVQLGVSVESDAYRDRINILRQTPAAVRFISCEPLIAPLSLRWLCGWSEPHPRHLNPNPMKGRIITDELDGLRELDWVICGGESGPGARPMHPDWARSLRDQCVTAGVPFFFKQWGEWQNGSLLPSDGRFDRVVYSDGEVVGVTEQEITAALKESRKEHSARRPCVMARVGKKAAGDLLDGVQWHEFPEAACV
jgi:protein gp37